MLHCFIICVFLAVLYPGVYSNCLHDGGVLFCDKFDPVLVGSEFDLRIRERITHLVMGTDGGKQYFF